MRELCEYLLEAWPGHLLLFLQRMLSSVSNWRCCYRTCTQIN